MSPFKKSLYLLTAVLCVGVAGNGFAQEKVEFKGTPEVKLDVCQAKVEVLSQKQTGNNIDLEVQITVAGCDGSCTGTLEYALIFTDAGKNEIQWQMTGGWDWRNVKSPFTLKLHEKAPPNAQLKEVKSMKIGRCSCSTVVRNTEPVTTVRQ